MRTMLVELRAGETVNISEASKVTLEHKSGQRARLRIEVPEGASIQIPREDGIATLIARKNISLRDSPKGD